MTTLVNRAKMTTATTGTGTITLGSAVSGYQSFADAGVADTNVVRYTIEDGTAWEIGTGTYTASGTTLSRTPSESSSAGAAINLSGNAVVYVTATAADLKTTYQRKTANYTAVAGDYIIADTSGGSWTLTLPASPSSGDVVVIADGANWATNNLTVGRNGSTIEGDAEDMTMNVGNVSVTFTYDGTTWQIYVQAGASAGTVLLSSDIGSTVQGYDPDLSAIAALSNADGNIIVGNGTTWVAESGATARTSLGLGTIATVAAPSGTVVGTTDIQTLTNKTITFSDNTLTDVASVSASQTLTNKTLTSPTITTPTITTPTITGAVLNDGYTEEVFAVSGTTPALSPNDGSIQTWTLSGNSTPTAGTWAAGQSITLMVDDGTAYTITWTSLPVTWKTDGGSAPTLNTTGETAIQLWKVGTTIYGARVGDA